MARVRMTGLASGLDTESMVKELISASSTKVDDANKDKQKLEWKKEAWQDLNTKLYNFYKTELNALRMPSTYTKKTATVSDDSKVSINAGSNTSAGTHTVSVKQIASSAYLTGANIKSADNAFKSVDNASNSTKFSEMTDANGDPITLGTGAIKVTGPDGAEHRIILNQVGDVNGLNDKFKELGLNGLSASIKDGKMTFTNSNAEEGQDFKIIASSAFGVEATLRGGTGESVSAASSRQLYSATEFTGADIKGTTKLSDLGIAVGTSFKINDKEFVVDEKTTINSLATGLSKLGVNASFDANQGRFYINSASSGAANDFTLTSSDANALEILGLGSKATKIDAQDAIIDYNGVEYRNSSNQFNINGMTITAKAVTGTYDKETGAFTNDSPISINVGNDTDSIYSTIKNFVNKYNELIEEMNKMYDEKKTDYEPLTEEERSALSDNQIEKWEEKAKAGLLYRDSTINSLLSNMRTILSKGVTVTNDDGSTTQYTLASLGIVTSNDWTEKGKLHIMGDEDDPVYAADENKLKAALEKNPNVFSKVFTGDDGIAKQLNTYMMGAMKKTETSHSLTFYNDITMDEEIDDYDDKIEELNKKLSDMEDKYYNQFAKMESAMAKLQQQQSYLASLMGTA
ncbi:MAG: flagellar filament capping protein FliD [Lachnospiraceae bacterium]|nr:flagellar filament capping protein FliD [Lachnospiraceae bacterium]